MTRALALAAVLLWAGALGRDRLDAWIDATVLPPLAAEASVEVRARDGTLLRAFTVAGDRWRLGATAPDVDPGYVAMLMAYEDRRFLHHRGVDPRAMLRAAGQAVTHRGIVSGGSTLTMQVARLLEASGTGAWRGKLRQIRVAVALERRLDKAAILDLYLMHAPFGGNIEGLRAASLAWFGKEPRRLTTAEAALLVALPQSPEARRPDRHPEAARAARARVLQRLETEGVIDHDTATSAAREPVPTVRHPAPILAPLLTERLRARTPTVTRIDTTLEARLQASLEALAGEAVRGRGDRLSAAIVAADHRTGEILASVGTPAFGDDRRLGFVDMTEALRSPGSTLKPLIYGLSFDEGLAHPETLIDDLPRAFGGWAPQNFDRTFQGTVRVREALQQSLNVPAVTVLDALGPARLMSALDRAHVRAVVPGGAPGLAVALGGVGVSLTDLVQVYAGIANGGMAVDLHATGAAGTPLRQLLSPVAAWEVGDILAGLTPPPGSPAHAIAYKTGTSYGHRDAWAIGFDGAHVIGVWMGRADGAPVPGAFGGDLAAPVLFRAFARLAPKPVRLPPPPPETLTVANADLPAPLRHFARRDAVFAPDRDAPELVFPPDGAEIETDGTPLAARVRGGTAPFTWLADGRPVALRERRRETSLDLAGPGWVDIAVIDAQGRTAHASVTLR